MSGPVTTDDSPAREGDDHQALPPTLERTRARAIELGGVTVRRALPRRARRTVGAWCFVDHFGTEADASATSRVAAGSGTMAVGPHPHIGLQTVTWLLDGEVLHTDSLGSEQLIRPGQLNLMTAGRGVVHAEQTPSPGSATPQHGAQLWVAQPDATRNGEPDFAHHADLPTVSLGHDVQATVLVGALAGERSPARTDTPLVGAAVEVGRDGRGTVALEPGFEYAVVVLTGTVSIAGADLDGEAPIVPGELAYLGANRAELGVHSAEGAHLLLLGGEPFETEPLMWWNFVARTRDEVAEARRHWQEGDDRFGPVRSELTRIDAPEALP